MSVVTLKKAPAGFMEIDPKLPYKVADLSLAEFGHKEMALAEKEMPGLMAVRAKYGPEQPLSGLKVMGSLHMTIQTAMLIDTLKALGADIRWGVVQYLQHPGSCGRRHCGKRNGRCVCLERRNPDQSTGGAQSKP